MRKMIAVIVFIAAALWHAPALHAEDEYYVQSMKAKVMSDATFKSQILGEVDRGYKFISSGKKGVWTKVRYKKEDGYVLSLVLLTHPPLEFASAITGDEQEQGRGFRRRASSSLGLETQRNVDRDEWKGRGRDEQADYESLEKVELFTMSSWEVKRFMEERQ